MSLNKTVGGTCRAIGIAAAILAALSLARLGRAAAPYGAVDEGTYLASLSLHDHAADADRAPSSSAEAGPAPLPALPYRGDGPTKPLASIGKIPLPGTDLTGTSTLWGVAVDLDDGGKGPGRSLRILAGATPPADAGATSGGYTTGLDWTQRLDAQDRVGLSVHFSQPAVAGGNGQWLARMASHFAPLPFLPDVKVETEMAMACSDAAPTHGAENVGSLVKLTGAPLEGLQYRIMLTRFGAAFHPEGFTMQAGREAVGADVHYRFASDVHLDAATEFAEESYNSPDPYRHNSASLTLSGPLLHAYMPALSAAVSTSAESEADRLGSLQMQTRQLAMNLAQPLWGGWRSRLGFSMDQTLDGVGPQNARSQGVRLAGNHHLRLGRFSGSIGPGVAWRERSGYRAHQDFEIGAAMKLSSRKQALAVDLGYLAQRGLPGAYDGGSVKVGIHYSLHFDDTVPASDDGAWYLSDAGAF